MIFSKSLSLPKHIVLTVIVLFISIFVFFYLAKHTSALVWTPQSGSGDRTWVSIDSSDDGVKLAAVDSGGYIYTSSNSGVDWVAQTNSGVRSWMSVTSSADGTKLAAVDFGGYVYTSVDSGQNWIEQTAGGARNWAGIASSADGTKLVAIVQGGNVHTSINSGVSWIEQTDLDPNMWAAVSSSSDGTKLAVVAQSSTVVVYTSSDSGSTWTANDVYEGDCTSVKSLSSSADGMKLAIGSCDGGGGNNYIYTSTDGGVTWIPRTASGSRYWYSVSSSNDGNVLLAADITSYPYLSIDGGATWEAQSSAGSATWLSVSVSGNGSVLSSGIYLGKIYTAGLVLDSTAPIVTEVTSVINPTNDTTPNYTFTTDEAGTITYGGSCSSGSTLATTGSNTITFNILADGIYSNCTVTVTDGASNASSPLSVSSFVVDATTPIITEMSSISETFDTTPSLSFTSSESGTITYGGSCNSSTTSVVSGSNVLNLNQLNYGSYADCTITITDVASNVSNTMTLSPFRVNAQGAVAVSSLPQPNKAPVEVAQNQKLDNTNKQANEKTDDKKIETNKSNCGVLPEVPNLMKIGAYHPSVKILQQILNCKGYIVNKQGYGAVGKETNYFGILTKNAVLRFQKTNNLLLQEGVVGPETRGALNN